MVGTNDGVTIYDAMSGAAVGQIERTDLRAVYISPINQLFVGTLGGELVHYDLDTLEPIRAFGGNTGIAQEIYTDAAGALLVARSGAGDVNMFDVATGEQIGSTISVPEGEANGDALRADGRELFLGGSDTMGTLYWDLDPEHWVGAACRFAGRDLTQEEWESNIGSLAPYRATCSDT